MKRPITCFHMQYKLSIYTYIYIYEWPVAWFACSTVRRRRGHAES